MSHFQRFAQGFKNLFVRKITKPSQEEQPLAEVPSKEANPNQEKSPPGEAPPADTAEKEPSSVAVASQESTGVKT